MTNQKNTYLYSLVIIGIVAVTAVVALLSGGLGGTTQQTSDENLVGDARFHPVQQSPSPQIQYLAESCALDATCEMNGAWIRTRADIDGLLYVASDIGTHGSVNVFGPELYVENSARFRGQIFAQDDLFVEDLLDAHVLQVSSLSGPGNAFACLDADGRLYRSVAPCQ